MLCNDNTDCTINCNDNHSCHNINIICPTNGNCDITCNSGSSGFSQEVCKGMTIKCPINGDCNIECNGDNSCKQLHIDARYASLLYIKCGTNEAKQTNNICTSMVVYFPPNINGVPQATISAGDNTFLYGTQFYAKYGWNDINIINDGENNIKHSGSMYCQDDYLSFCGFKTDKWACTNDEDICNNPANTLQFGTDSLCF